MASRQAALLTPLESFHPRPLPSRHLINRVHSSFCKKQPFSFHALAGTHFATLLFSISCRNGGYPLRIPRRMRILSDHRQSKGAAPGSRRFSPEVVRILSDHRESKSSSPDSALPLSLLDATLTRHPISVHSKGLTEALTSLDATLTKNGGREIVIANIVSLATPGLSCMHCHANHS
jgi:hypothetical protein